MKCGEWPYQERGTGSRTAFTHAGTEITEDLVGGGGLVWGGWVDLGAVGRGIIIIVLR